jgi:hypothetical protein
MGLSGLFAHGILVPNSIASGSVRMQNFIVMPQRGQLDELARNPLLRVNMRPGYIPAMETLCRAASFDFINRALGCASEIKRIWHEKWQFNGSFMAVFGIKVAYFISGGFGQAPQLPIFRDSSFRLHLLL